MLAESPQALAARPLAYSVSPLFWGTFVRSRSQRLLGGLELLDAPLSRGTCWYPVRQTAAISIDEDSYMPKKKTAAARSSKRGAAPGVKVLKASNLTVAAPDFGRPVIYRGIKIEPPIAGKRSPLARAIRDDLRKQSEQARRKLA